MTLHVRHPKRADPRWCGCGHPWHEHQRLDTPRPTIGVHGVIDAPMQVTIVCRGCSCRRLLPPPMSPIVRNGLPQLGGKA
jgi:hypothetical protein